MFLSINFESEVPIYTQIRQQIIEGIASGKLKYGESLPTVRQLAADLGINMHTVNKAYTLLKQDGFVVIHKRDGALVAPADRMVSEKNSESLQQALYFLIAEMICRGKGPHAITEEVQSIYRMIKEGDENV